MIIMTNANNAVEGRELGWDDPIEKESEFTLLPPGEYDFTVTRFERARHIPKPGAKLPACNKANLTLTVNTPGGPVNIFHTLFMHSSMEGALTAFFTGIGQRKKGERLQPRWHEVVGAEGRAEIEINQYQSGGQDRENNRVKKFIEPAAAQTPAPNNQTFVQGQF